MIYAFKKIFLAFSDTLKLSWKEYALVCVFFFCLLYGSWIRSSVVCNYMGMIMVSLSLASEFT